MRLDEIFYTHEPVKTSKPENYYYLRTVTKIIKENPRLLRKLKKIHNTLNWGMLMDFVEDVIDIMIEERNKIGLTDLEFNDYEKIKDVIISAIGRQLKVLVDEYSEESFLKKMLLILSNNFQRFLK